MNHRGAAGSEYQRYCGARAGPQVTHGNDAGGPVPGFQLDSQRALHCPLALAQNDRGVVPACGQRSSPSLAPAALLAFQYRYEESAAPFRRIFTRADLAALMQRLKARPLAAAA